MTETPSHRVARRIIDAALSAADPTHALRRAIRPEDGSIRLGQMTLPDPDARVALLSAGKAARPMAMAAREALGGRIQRMMVIAPDGDAGTVPDADLWRAGHPLPNAGGLAAAGEALRLARSLGRDDLFLVLLSGGASALLAAPVPGLSLAHLRSATDALLRSGASIQEVNTVRRHLSAVGGGGLARAAWPAATVTMAISDVIGGRPYDIGSGPGVPDETSFADALEVVHTHQLRLPVEALDVLRRGAAGLIPETLRAGELDPSPEFIEIASIRDALAAAAEAATHLGYQPQVSDAPLLGPAADAGRAVARAAIEAAGHGTRRVLIWGGETTVRVTGGGRGGRNQEVAAAAAIEIAGFRGITIAAFATDGIDGPTPAAGAVVDGATRMKAREADHDLQLALDRNDTYPALDAAGALIVTGLTGTNVNDITIAVIDPAAREALAA